MVAAEKELSERSATTDVEGADSFRAVNLVSGERKQVDLQSVYIDR